MIDHLDGVEEAARRATARARRLAKLLGEAGMRVGVVTEATLEVDAAVILDESEHIQVGVDGTYTRVRGTGDKMVFETPVTSAASVVVMLTGGESLYEKEWRVYAQIAEAVNQIDPKLSARPGEDSPGIFNVRVRVAPRLAAYFGQDVTWSGAVAVALDEFGCEWENREDEGDIFSLKDAPSLDFDGKAATNPVYEQEEVTPVAVSDESVRQVAEAIVRASRHLAEHSPQPEGFVGYEFLELWRDVQNPKPDRRRTHDWRARERFEKGERFVLILRSGGEIPSLYPAGVFSHSGALPATSLFAALLPSLTTSRPKLRDLFTVEGGDPVDVLETLASGGVVSYDFILRTMRAKRRDVSRRASGFCRPET